MADYTDLEIIELECEIDRMKKLLETKQAELDCLRETHNSLKDCIYRLNRDYS